MIAAANTHHAYHDDSPVEIEFIVLPGSRGSYDRYGAPQEPEAPAEVEITAIRAMNGEETRPDRKQIKAWVREIEASLKIQP